MSVSINLKTIGKGYEIVRMECPNCHAKFVFRLEDKKVKDVLEDVVADLEKKTVKCNTCETTFEYELYEPTGTFV